MGYHRQIQRERVDSIQLAEDWFQLPDSVKKDNNTCGTTKSDNNVLINCVTVNCLRTNLTAILITQEKYFTALLHETVLCASDMSLAETSGTSILKAFAW